jgi:hypothetical protein
MCWKNKYSFRLVLGLEGNVNALLLFLGNKVVRELITDLRPHWQWRQVVVADKIFGQVYAF